MFVPSRMNEIGKPYHAGYVKDPEPADITRLRLFFVIYKYLHNFTSAKHTVCLRSIPALQLSVSSKHRHTPYGNHAEGENEEQTACLRNGNLLLDNIM